MASNSLLPDARRASGLDRAEHAIDLGLDDRCDHRAGLVAVGAVEQFPGDHLEGDDLVGDRMPEARGGIVLALGELGLPPEVLVAGLRVRRLEHDFDRDDVDNDTDEGGSDEHPQPGREEMQMDVDPAR